MYKGIQKQSVLIQALKLAPAGLSFLVSARRVRSCSTRSPTRLWHPASLYLLHPCSRMNLARLNALHSALQPRPGHLMNTCEMFGLGMFATDLTCSMAIGDSCK